MYKVGDELIVERVPVTTNTCRMRIGAVWFVDKITKRGAYVVRHKVHQRYKHIVSAGGWLDCFSKYDPGVEINLESENTPNNFSFTTSQRIDLDEIFGAITRSNPIGIATIDDGVAIVALHNSYISAEPELEDHEYFSGTTTGLNLATFGMLVTDLKDFLTGVRQINRSLGRSRTVTVSITK